MAFKAINLGAGQWGISCQSFSPALVSVGRAIPGLKFDKSAKIWAGTADAVAAGIAKLEEMKLNVDSKSAPTAITIPKGYVVQVTPWRCVALRSYQDAGVEFLSSGPARILADDMGLGKTAQTCGAIARVLFAGERVLVICPNSVRSVWVEELAKWLYPAPVVFQPRGKFGGEIPAEASFVVVNYDILSEWADVLAAWSPKVVVFDEAHYLQNEKSKRSKAARTVSQDASFRWALTGTPMLNRPKDLWNLLDTLSPSSFGNFFSFGVRYCNAHQEQVTPEKVVWKFDGSSNEAELAARMKFYMLRRLKSEVAIELPPKTRQIVHVDVQGRFDRLTTWNPTAARKALEVAADKKIPAALELVRGHLEQGAKVVVFTWRKAVAELVATTFQEEGYESTYVTGDVPPEKRVERAERTAAAPGAALLAATIDSFGVGTNKLTFASVAVFVELTWEPTDLLQAEARLHRSGQKNPVFIQYVIARGTNDEIVASVVVSKLDNFEKIIGDTGETLGGQLAGTQGDILDELSRWAAKVAEGN